MHESVQYQDVVERHSHYESTEQINTDLSNITYCLSKYWTVHQRYNVTSLPHDVMHIHIWLLQILVEGLNDCAACDVHFQPGRPKQQLPVVEWLYVNVWLKDVTSLRKDTRR